MSVLALRVNAITSTTPISEAIAASVHVSALPGPELADLVVSVWQSSFTEQVKEISKLKAGWDGFQAGPIRLDVIKFAIHVLQEIMLPNTPAPHLTPMSHEGLMLEWHQNGIDLEIEIEKPGQLWMSFEDVIDKIDQEKPLSSDLATLVTPIQTLTNRA